MAILQNIRVRTSVVCVYNGSVLAFRAVDPTTKKHFVFLPGGKIEDGETPEHAAVRETLEETGYEIELTSSVPRQEQYLFDWDGAMHDCLTYFYAARLKNPNKKPIRVNDASYHKGICWVPIADCKQVFAYHPTIQKVMLEYLVR